MNFKNKLLGSYYGSIIGDQAGQYLEFKKEENQYYKNYLDMGYGFKSGIWTDDSSMTLCTILSLTEKKELNIENLMEYFLDWFENANYTVNNKPYDCGSLTFQRLMTYKKSKELISPYNNDNQSGNGSLMRIAPIAWHYYKDFLELKEKTYICSAATHSSKKCIDSCILQTNLIAQILNGTLKEELKNIFENDLCLEVNNIFNNRNIKEFNNENQSFVGTTNRHFGYVIDSLDIALYSFFSTNDFTEGLFKCINLKGDTDTNAAIYGQLAGAYYGLDNIDKFFLENLKRKDFLDNVITNYLNLNF